MIVELNNEELLALFDLRCAELKQMVRHRNDCPANRASHIKRICEALNAIAAAPSHGRSSDRDREVVVVSVDRREPINT